MQRLWLFHLPCSCSHARNPFHHNHSIASLQGRRPKVLDRLVHRDRVLTSMVYARLLPGPTAQLYIPHLIVGSTDVKEIISEMYLPVSMV